MADSGRLDELHRKFDENPRRYFAPLANEYRKSGSLERAIELCRTYLPQQPGHMSGYVVYGQALFDAGRMEEAGSIFQQALSLDAENIIALVHLGDIARETGDDAVALQWYRRVLDIDPKNEEVARHVAGLTGDAAPVPPPAPEPQVPLSSVHPEPPPGSGEVVLSDLVVEPEGVEPEARPSPEAGAADGVEEPLPSITEFVLTPAPAPDAESQPERDHAPDEVGEAAGDPPPDEVPTAPFMTETMAELYLQQGFTEQALEIYQQLARRGAAPRIHDMARRLAAQLDAAHRAAESAPDPAPEPPPEPVSAPASEPVSAPAPAPASEPLPGPGPHATVTVRDFFARLGARRPVAATAEHAAVASPPAAHGVGPGPLETLFSVAPLDPSDARAAETLAGAYTRSR